MTAHRRSPLSAATAAALVLLLGATDFIAAWFSRPEQRDAFVALARGLDFDETHERLADVQAPTLIVWGAADSWIPSTQAQGLAERIPEATAEVLEGCGHNVHEDCPGPVIRLLTDFLAA
ncbi:alpha/beta fold hydrolase [Glycomyces albidus]|uniref:Alpha/beta fold hydrolase n=1 Tax=Glycomyces albidus TaxID=2656774 RepID=A0A6L5G7A1_9ACTN|nr:alpha/beta fold hydrolase [Glycomyces albidus]MQM25491.1 alpha/beta fold hydrolase [Glycomyces albidus]